MNQESGRIKQLKLRVPMELYVQLEKDAAVHNEPPSTRARHILLDSLMNVELTAADIEHVEDLVAQNWERLRKGARA